MKAVVNRVIPFSSVDGPGNRTAVFLQGCNIDCKYCHNPETRALCSDCGRCIEICPAGALYADQNGRVIWEEKKCVSCDSCIHVCPNSSSPRTKEMTPEEVYAKVKRQIPFIRGLTVSGGECMLQPHFLEKLFSLAKKDRLNTMIDSNGTILFENYPTLLGVTDGVMLDIKAFDGQEHQKITGVGNDTVLKNVEFLAKNHKLYEARAVIVPDLYDTEKSVRDMAAFLAPLREETSFRIKLIAYRPMGVREKFSHYEVPSQTYLEKLAEILRSYGLRDIVTI